MAADDEQHLRLLSIFHYVVAGLTALFALLPLIYFALGWFLLHAPPSKNGEAPPPAFVAYIIMGFGALFFLLGESFAGLIFASGRCLSSRTRYWLVFIMACIQCACFPFGTVLGVFTIVVLSRPSVKQMFGLPSNENTSPVIPG
jgi:hypothetical protein